MKGIFSAIGRYLKGTDRTLYLFCLSASALSVIFQIGIVYSDLLPDYRTTRVQIFAILLGVVAAIILSKIDYRTLAKLWPLHVPFAYFMVLLTFVIGTQRGDADDKAWIMIPYLKIGFQPAEILKISFILSFSYHLERVRENLNHIRNVLLLGIHGMAPVLLIHLQGDDGTALVFALVFICMIFSAGIHWRYILSASVIAIASLPVLWFTVMSEDQKLRILSLLDPEKYKQGIGWQQYQGRISIGSGQVWGQGIFSGTHRSSVPEIYNDFIFAFIGESLGFVGSAAVLILLAAICIKILLISRVAGDYLGKYICVGVFAIITSQIFINIGMCLSFLPVIGITLPFLSAGGTSVSTLYLGIGLALSVYMHNKTTLFSE